MITKNNPFNVVMATELTIVVSELEQLERQIGVLRSRIDAVLRLGVEDGDPADVNQSSPVTLCMSTAPALWEPMDRGTGDAGAQNESNADNLVESDACGRSSYGAENETVAPAVTAEVSTDETTIAATTIETDNAAAGDLEASFVHAQDTTAPSDPAAIELSIVDDVGLEQIQAADNTTDTDETDPTELDREQTTPYASESAGDTTRIEVSGPDSAAAIAPVAADANDAEMREAVLETGGGEDIAIYDHLEVVDQSEEVDALKSDANNQSINTEANAEVSELRDATAGAAAAEAQTDEPADVLSGVHDLSGSIPLATSEIVIPAFFETEPKAAEASRDATADSDFGSANDELMIADLTQTCDELCPNASAPNAKMHEAVTEATAAVETTTDRPVGSEAAEPVVGALPAGRRNLFAPRYGFAILASVTTTAVAGFVLIHPEVAIRKLMELIG